VLSPPGDNPPSLSLLVVCRNHERFVDACLRSIFETVDQPCDLVFLDNGSRDRSVEIAKATLRDAPSFITSTKVIALDPELPLPRALNLANAECRGEIVKGISSDDKYGPNLFTALRRAVATSDPKVGIWLCGSVIIDDDDKVTDQHYGPAPFGSPDDGPPVFLTERMVIEYREGPRLSAASFFYRKKVLADIGGFDERFRYEDKPFFFNALKHGWKVAVHPYNNTYYRVHGGGISTNPAWMAEARVAVLVDQTLRARWRNKPLALNRLARAVRVVAKNRWRAWRAGT
jgi:alpha-1,3-rhamnosyltransferase